MSYAIIRNEKYKRENLKGIYKHNERKDKNYSNKNIDKTKSHLNYSLKEATMSYDKLFDKIKAVILRRKFNLYISFIDNVPLKILFRKKGKKRN